MSYLLDTNVLSELRRKAPDTSVVEWLTYPGNISGGIMHSHDYQKSISAKISAAEAFSRIQAVSRWWTKGVTGCAENLNDLFTVRFGETFVDFKVCEIDPPSKIVWQVIDSDLPWLKNKGEWTGTKVVWEVSRGAIATQITMTHVGLSPAVECYEKCEAGWNFFVGESLSRLMTENRGMPDREQSASE